MKKFAMLFFTIFLLVGCSADKSKSVQWNMSVDELKSQVSVVDVSSEYGTNESVFRCNNQEVFGVNSDVVYMFFDGKLEVVQCDNIKSDDLSQSELFDAIKSNITEKYGTVIEEDEWYCMWSDSGKTEIILANSSLSYSEFRYVIDDEKLTINFYSKEYLDNLVIDS